MKPVSILAPKGAIQIDVDRLGQVYADHGARRADIVVAQALLELAYRLNIMECHYYASDYAKLGKTAHGIVGIADRIGLTQLADVALDLYDVSHTADGPAIAATLARVIRIGDQSVNAIWEIKDIHGVI